LVVCVYAIVPVASYEPESQITKSIERLKELACDNFTLNICYAIETFPGDKRTLHLELPDNFTILLRDTHRGNRAGNINAALNKIKNAGHNPDYVAIFDVDLRPAKDYLIKCIAALEENDDAVFSGWFHFATNKPNTLTKVIAIEHTLMHDLYRLLSHFDSFLILFGVVVKGSFFTDEKFDEHALLDDFDLTTRAYLKGKVAVLANTTMGGQVPTTFRDFYHQRVRWYGGVLESLAKYLIPMAKAPIPFSRKLSWLFLATGPLWVYLETPLFFSYLGDMKKLSNGPLEFVKIFVGSMAYPLLLTACAIVAITKISKQFEWKPSIRSEVESGDEQ
jgi:cellulose synthase/poly-beta-1,6-N-acetylglucosamine synthase-like glycosyltransferase